MGRTVKATIAFGIDLEFPKASQGGFFAHIPIRSKDFYLVTIE